MTGPTQRTTPASTAEARAAEAHEAEQRLAEQHEAGRAGGGRPDWSPLPRRAGLKPSASPLFSLRTPISAASRWTLAVLSFAIPFIAWGYCTNSRSSGHNLALAEIQTLSCDKKVRPS